MSAVRADQTENRAGFDYIQPGRDGEYRIHPIIDWTEEDAVKFISQEGLAEHPLAQLYGSIGDRITTVPGEGREGRLLEGGECGMQLLPDGRLVRKAA